jgi:hypothetical protein
MSKELQQRIRELAEHLLNFEQSARVKKQKRSPASVEKFHLSTAWLCKRLLAAHAASPNFGMRIARDKNRYKKSRYVPEGITFDIAIEGVLLAMEIDGFVRQLRGGEFSRNTGLGKQTRIAATTKLVDWFAESDSLLPKKLVGCEDTDPLLVQITTKKKVTNLKGKQVVQKHKRLVDYKETGSTKRMRDNLELINDCLKRHWSDLYLSDAEWFELQRSLMSNKEHHYSPVQLHRQTVRRIFNDTEFRTGGRFYGGWWQNIPSIYRRFITIDGKRTSEFDFGRLHPTILYAQERLVLSEDAYDIGIGEEHRDVVKKLFNAMVHMKKPQDNPPKVKFSQTGKTWKQLRDLILEKHEPIRHKFFCGKGNELQYEDSKIAELVMLHFAKQDIAVLPVHDSFIIQRSLEDWLVQAMHEAFRNFYDVPIKIRDAAKFLAMDFQTSGEVVVEDLVKHMTEYNGWWRRNCE